MPNEFEKKVVIFVKKVVIKSGIYIFKFWIFGEPILKCLWWLDNIAQEVFENHVSYA